MIRRRAALFVVALWAVGVAGGLAARKAWLIDETRYLAVAWEMWTGGDLLLPHLNDAIDDRSIEIRRHEAGAHSLELMLATLPAREDGAPRRLDGDDERA